MKHAVLADVRSSTAVRPRPRMPTWSSLHDLTPLTLALSFGCGSPHAAHTPLSPPKARVATGNAQTTAGLSLRERLKRAIGRNGPVALVASEAGIVAVGPDGTRALVVSGAVAWLFVDDRADVVWYEARVESGFELRILDWSLPAASPERVATGLGEDDAEDVAIAYAEATYGPEEVSSHAGEYDGYVRLLMTAAGPVWSYQDGIYDDIFERTDEVRPRRLAPLAFVPSATARLRELNERARGKSLLLGVAPQPQPDAAPAVEKTRCWDSALCGSGQPLPGTPWWRVIVRHECGDACHVHYQLYDPATREFFDHESGKRSALPLESDERADVDDVWIAAGGEGFLIAGSVYDRAGKRLFRGSGRGGGWLGGQWSLK